jgi:outer membrane protein OmpA-like peptidoglycan-associated protein
MNYFNFVFLFLCVFLYTNSSAQIKNIIKVQEKVQVLQTSFEEVKEKINQKDVAEFILNPTRRIENDRHQRYLERLKNEIRVVEGLIGSLLKNEAEIIKDYFKMIINSIKIKISILLLKCEDPLWQRTRITNKKLVIEGIIFNDLKNTINKSINYCYDDYLDSKDFIDPFENIKPTSKYNKILEGLNLSNAYDAYQVIENLENSIMLYNQFLYNDIVIDTTIKQLEIYLENRIQNENYYEKRLPLQALKSLFLAYTQTGEFVTIEECKKFFEDSGFERLMEEEEFKQLFAEKMAIAMRKSRILNSSSLSPIKVYEDLIQRHNDDMNVIAVQKIIKQQQQVDLSFSKKDLIKVLQKYEFHFKEDDSYQRFLQQLRAADTADYNLVKIPIDEACKPENVREFFINDNKLILGLLSGVSTPKRATTIYNFQNLWSREYKNDQGNNFGQYYYFSVDGSPIFKGLTSSSELKKGKTIRDIFIHKDGDIMLFISTDTRNMYKNSAIDDPNYYINSFRNDTESILRSTTNGKGSFRGRKNGYQNTEIYYSFKKNDTKSADWDTPKLLKKLSTPYTERAPSFSADGEYIYFASDAYMGWGGFDIYKVRISIDRYKKEITVKAPPVNLHYLNSPADELFFRENNTKQFLSTNKTGKWCIYEVEKKPITGVSSPWEHENTLKGDDLVIKVKCKYDPSNSTEDIFVKGTVYTRDGKSVSGGEISFFNIDKDYDSAPSRIGKNGEYRAYITPGLKYQVTASSSVGGKPLKYLFQDFIDVCGENNRMEYNPVLALTSNEFKIKMKAPFLFAFGKANVDLDINNFSKMQGAYEFFREFKKLKDKDESRYLIIKGYADTLGNYLEGCDLGKKRAKSVRDFLLREYPMLKNIDIKVESGCRTSKFDNDPDYDNYLTYMTPSFTSEQSLEEKNMQKNRRVEVFLVDTEKFIDNPRSTEKTLRATTGELIKVKFTCYSRKDKSGVRIEGTVLESPAYEQLYFECDQEAVSIRVKNREFAFNLNGQQQANKLVEFIVNKNMLDGKVILKNNIKMCPME